MLLLLFLLCTNPKLTYSVKSKDTVKSTRPKIKNRASANCVWPAAAVAAVMSARPDDLARECCVISAGCLSANGKRSQQNGHPASQPVSRAAKRPRLYQQNYNAGLCVSLCVCGDKPKPALMTPRSCIELLRQSCMLEAVRETGAATHGGVTGNWLESLTQQSFAPLTGKLTAWQLIAPLMHCHADKTCSTAKNSSTVPKNSKWHISHCQWAEAQQQHRYISFGMQHTHCSVSRWRR